ncbi:MAG: hypothetical protein AB7V32_11435, partial [Candidatus Berkiella sp.]
MMKYTVTLCLGFIVCTAYASKEEQNLLPENYKVYYIENVGVLNHSAPGAIEKKLPTMNEFKGSPGCYIA